jgi:protein-disulfide isomerase
MSRKRNRRPTRPAGETTLELSWSWLLLGAALLALLVGVGAAVVMRRPPATPRATAPELAAGQFPQHDSDAGLTADGVPYLGSLDAPITLVEFSDYQCPNCGMFARDTLPQLRSQWVAPGQVRFVYRDFAIRGDLSIRAAEAAHCAKEQGRFWSYHDLLFEHQGALHDTNLVDYATRIGLATGAFEACLTSGRYRQFVLDSTQEGIQNKYEGTPTFLVNGRRTQGAIPADEWSELFALMLYELRTPVRPPG